MRHNTLVNKKPSGVRTKAGAWRGYFNSHGYRNCIFKPIADSSLDGIEISSPNGIPFILLIFQTEGDYARIEPSILDFLELRETISLVVIFDGTKDPKVFIYKHCNKELQHAKRLENYKNATGKNLFVKNNGDNLSPLDNRVENIFFEIHSTIRDIDGLHEDEALDELCKIITCKVFDENTTKSKNPYKLQRSKYGNNFEFDAAIKNLYIEAERNRHVNGSKSKGIREASIKLSVPALTKAVELLQAYDLMGSTIDIKGRAFQKVLSRAMRSGMGQFFTPHQIAEMMAQVLGPAPGDEILDPFCGSAHFLTTCKKILTENYSHNKNRLSLHGIEKSERMARIASADIELHGGSSANIINNDALIDFENYRYLEPESFDIVITNPPFGSLLSPDSLSHLADFELAKPGTNTPLEVLGIERSVQFLKPGGKLGIVIPEGILTNRKTSHVRKWIEKNIKVRIIVSLPVETFSPFGANVKTSVIFARKYLPGEVRDNYKLAMLQSEKIGYDASGRPSSSDIDALVKEAQSFISKEGW